MKFENNKIKIEYPDKWTEQEHTIKDCLLVLDHKDKRSRIMLMENPNQAVNINHLKSAVELFPRDESLKVLESRINTINNMPIHELTAINPNCSPPLKTKSIGFIDNKDVYIFNYMTFGLNNHEDDEFNQILESVEFKS